MYFRAFHAVPGKAPDGTPVGAVRGFLDALARLLRAYPAQRVVACLDADWRPAFRVTALPSYKAHRVGPDGAEIVPVELGSQVPVLLEVLAAVGIPAVGSPGYEADDVIGTLTSSAAATGATAVDIMTGDRDLFQLIDDEVPVRVLYTGGGGVKPMDEAAITARYGIPGRAYADFATLRGDPSDGLPGVPGIGERSAAAILDRFGTLAQARAAAAAGSGQFPAGARARLLAAADYLERAVRVVAVATQASLPAFADRLPDQPAQPAALAALSARLGLDSPLNRLGAALGWRAVGSVAESNP